MSTIFLAQPARIGKLFESVDFLLGRRHRLQKLTTIRLEKIVGIATGQALCRIARLISGDLLKTPDFELRHQTFRGLLSFLDHA
jgi:hypothetical protein